MSQTYEEILQGMLDKVPSNVDKREGSIIYDALAPCAYFLAQQQFQLDNFVELVFADTAVGEYLDTAVSDFGLTRKGASAAIRQVTTSAAISIGTVWGINELAYTITELIATNQYKAKCNTAGTIGNQYTGSMSPISSVSGVTATLGDVLTAGTDIETDDALRARLYNKVRMPATSGNAYQYKQWALEVSGVGDAKVFPLDSGPGTVTVIIVDDNKAISETLPETVAEYIETVRPIGATVTVTSPTAKQINITASVILDGSKTIGEVETTFNTAIESFLADTVFSSYSISYAKIGGLLLDTVGVEDYNGLMVNSGTGNVTIGSKEIPVKGVVSLTEV
ncbi:baseplate J/gp47 family protein [Lacrimispora saccharolytica]|uniref:Baseplate J family protein n=1 Tax=Lacrimispora saccharolytica (strain ATCC 35040 / DSM 2544 / NRCC 2533 / WM1) TaxID=610130 RepID=D9R935_LACSW|nr:baseplate J/gp47 family protein [Lacrimispora saccharolytica]ADL04010.1 Baseplate J family protein [[Clostridium] saccharolyticum WM1]QRV21689.1 baseplate J/gp47 family protein [Lacrimispora saccharolytica]